MLFTAYIIHVGFFYRGNFNDIGGKTEDGTNPKQQGKATEQLSTELHPLRGGGWGGQAIGTISHMKLICSFLCMTLGKHNKTILFFIKSPLKLTRKEMETASESPMISFS